MSAFTFSGKTAIVTGAGGGIGLQVAQDLLAQNINVVAVDVKPHPDTLGNQRLAYLQRDVTEQSACEEAIKTAQTKFGTTDYLVLAAGICPDGDGSLLEIDREIADRVMEINFKSAVSLVRVATEALSQSDHAAIVMVASMVGLRNMENIMDNGPMDAYQMSKAALVSFSRSLAIQLAPKGIRSNTVCPGPALTPMTDAVYQDPARVDAIVARTPLGRLGLPPDVSAACLYLLSDQASFVTGIDLIVDGGLMAKA